MSEVTTIGLDIAKHVVRAGGLVLELGVELQLINAPQPRKGPH